MRDELIKFTSNSLGRINSRAVTQAYFAKQGRSDLWEYFQSNYSHMDVSDHEKLAWIRSGYNSIPDCSCGKKATLLNGKPSKYCSQRCVLQSSNRINKLKQSLQSSDKSLSNAKRAATMKEMYGVSYNSQRTDKKHIWKRSKLTSQNALSKLSDKSWLDIEYNINKRTATDIAIDLNVYYGTVIDYCRKYGFVIRSGFNQSRHEKIISSLLDELGVEHIQGDRTVIDGLELDIYVPSHKLAIEVNGLYWHSFPECKSKHIEKYNRCVEKGIRLLQFTDLEIDTKYRIVRSMIVSRLGLSTRLYARKCDVRPVSVKDARIFMNAYHLHGFAGAAEHLGLYHNDILVMVMSWGRSRFNSKNNEIVRLCTIGEHVVVGGFSKLLKSSGVAGIISYCDKMFSDGHGYEAVGFKQIGETDPGYFWTDGDVVISRQKCQRSSLSKWLPSFDETKSEAENMTSAGYRQYWNCGNIIYFYSEDKL